jgi:hypothetical protein
MGGSRGSLPLSPFPRSSSAKFMLVRSRRDSCGELRLGETCEAASIPLRPSAGSVAGLRLRPTALFPAPPSFWLAWTSPLLTSPRSSAADGIYRKYSRVLLGREDPAGEHEDERRQDERRTRNATALENGEFPNLASKTRFAPKPTPHLGKAPFARW